MKILNHKIDEKNHVYNFVVTPDQEEWKKEYQKVLSRFAKQVKLRGYRPGKVPPNIAVKFINPQMIYQQAIQKFTKPVYDELIQNKTVQEQEIIEDSFRINVNNVSPTELELTYIFDLIPKVTIKNYKDIKNISFKKQTVTDAEVKKSLEDLSKNKKLDDKFVLSLNIKNLKTVYDLKKYQKQILQWQKDEKEFLRVRSLLEDEIIKRTTVDYVPEKIIRQQENVLLRQYQTNSMSSRNIIDSWLERDKTIDKKLPFNEKIKKLAKQTVILSLALEKIMEDNKIELTDADRKKYYEKFAFSRGISMDDAKKQLSGDSNEALMVHEKIFKTLVDMNKNNKAK